jgi:glycosyltransferase involved in cell wall biosynthesis
MKILYLTFYFEPDLCPGSFRNTTLVGELASQLTARDSIQVITTHPNRYASYSPAAPDRDVWPTEGCPVLVQRIRVPKHKSGLIGQIMAFLTYFRSAHQYTKEADYDLVIASSSRLFTAFLGARLARKRTIPLFLDIRDLFREAIAEVVRFPLAHTCLNPLLKLVEHYTFNYATHINLVSEGFRSYFNSYRQATYSCCTNGIDAPFLAVPASQPPLNHPFKTILYAGNIGEGQGLHKLIPEAARQLGNQFRFVVIGDGGAREKLQAALLEKQCTNVELRPPCNRQTLIAAYQNADYLLVHLNDWDACQRVLPSKLFEYGATDKPILAGVCGYAASFIRDHLPNTLVFNPTDTTSLVRQLRETPYQTQDRVDFKRQFARHTVNQELARHILRAGEKATYSAPTVHTP